MFLPLHDANALKHVKIQYVTLFLIAANILIWIFWSTPSITSEKAVRAAYLSFGYIPAVINGFETLPVNFVILPEQAAYVTYSFFHSNFMHLAGNMLFLWVFGDNVEDALGHFKFLFFYLACAAAGAWAHGAINPQSVSPLIGASGAAAGVIAAYLILHPKVKIWVLMFGKIPLRISALWVIGAWISYQVFEMIFNSGSDVSWGAHVGGIVTGAFLVLFMRRSGVELFDRKRENKLAVEPVRDVQENEAEAIQAKADQASPWGRDGGGN
ncbi:MAG: rhomboid family intramembrane serine protease [Hyphomicrobiales bacterium]|nr:rhomboid family intramembrane serine protease [Hyphomicrobiales bacterium]